MSILELVAAQAALDVYDAPVVSILRRLGETYDECGIEIRLPCSCGVFVADSFVDGISYRGVDVLTSLFHRMFDSHRCPEQKPIVISNADPGVLTLTMPSYNMKVRLSDDEDQGTK